MIPVWSPARAVRAGNALAVGARALLLAAAYCGSVARVHSPPPPLGALDLLVAAGCGLRALTSATANGTDALPQRRQVLCDLPLHSAGFAGRHLPKHNFRFFE